jgi:hypothetical protein
MTQVEAYRFLGWPLEGRVFVLPISETNEGLEHIPVRCDTCNMLGISTVEFHEQTKGVCAQCGDVLIVPPELKPQKGF